MTRNLNYNNLILSSSYWLERVLVRKYGSNKWLNNNRWIEKTRNIQQRKLLTITEQSMPHVWIHLFELLTFLFLKTKFRYSSNVALSISFRFKANNIPFVLFSYKTNTIVSLLLHKDRKA